MAETVVQMSINILPKNIANFPFGELGDVMDILADSSEACNNMTCREDTLKCLCEAVKNFGSQCNDVLDSYQVTARVAAALIRYNEQFNNREA